MNYKNIEINCYVPTVDHTELLQGLQDGTISSIASEEVTNEQLIEISLRQQNYLKYEIEELILPLLKDGWEILTITPSQYALNSNEGNGWLTVEKYTYHMIKK